MVGMYDEKFQQKSSSLFYEDVKFKGFSMCVYVKYVNEYTLFIIVTCPITKYLIMTGKNLFSTK